MSIEPLAWLPTKTIDWLHDYEGRACGRDTVVYNKPIKTDGGVPICRYDEAEAEITRLTVEIEEIRRDNASFIEANTDLVSEVETLRQQLAEERNKALEDVAALVEGNIGKVPITNAFAVLVSRNNQPCMSGDARDRLNKYDRLSFDDAAHDLADAIRAMKDKP